MQDKIEQVFPGKEEIPIEFNDKKNGAKRILGER